MSRDWKDETAGALVAAIPGVGPLAALAVTYLTEKSREELARNQSRALAAAEKVAGLSREELRERIDSDPRLVSLVARVLFEAGVTGQDEVLDALGAALGDALADPSRSDDAELILLGISRIRRSHIELLRLLASHPGSAPEADAPYWNLGNVADLTGVGLDEASRLANDLLGAGFLRGDPAFGTIAYWITEHGKTLLEVLQTLESDDSI
jgi:hypothetical protein